jgi:hypothetical protein
MRVLRHCKVPRAEVVFVIVQRENIHPSNKEMNKTVTMQSKLPDVCSLAVNHYVSLSLTKMKSSVHLHALNCTNDFFTPQGSTLWTVVAVYTSVVEQWAPLK